MAGTINMAELSGGAKISRIFHERFPYEILKSYDSCQDAKELRKEISYAIRNVHGIRVGLFTPDQAFDVIVRKKIEKLKEPSFKCVDLVVQEITNVIRSSTDKLRKFPRFKEEVERIMTSYMREREQRCRDQINLILNCELSYTNTNHDDFAGHSYTHVNHGGGFVANGVGSGSSGGVSGGGGSSPFMDAGVGRTKSVGNEVIRKGYLSIMNLGFFTASREFWFVLTTSSLTWYKDMEEKDKKYVMPLDSIRLRDLESGGSGLKGRRPVFALYNPDGRNVCRDWRALELSCETQDDCDGWKASLLRVGVYPDRSKSEKKNSVMYSSSGEMMSSSGSTLLSSSDGAGNGSNDGGSSNCVDPQLERQVEIIRSLVDSYMKIVVKTCRDIVPKTIMHLLINDMKMFVHGEMAAHCYSIGDPKYLMEEGQEEAVRREELQRQYQACKEALAIISTVSVPGPASGGHGGVGGGLMGPPARPPPQYLGSMVQSYSSQSLNSVGGGNPKTPSPHHSATTPTMSSSAFSAFPATTPGSYPSRATPTGGMQGQPFRTAPPLPPGRPKPPPPPRTSPGLPEPLIPSSFS